jgi:hypothetical protein
MIKLRSKPTKEVKNFRVVPSEWTIESLFAYPGSVFYYEKDGQEFMYVTELKSLFLPSDCTLNPEDIENDLSVDISDWTFTKLSDENPGYTLNQLSRGISYFREKFNTSDSGLWIVENKCVSVSFEFYLRVTKTEYNTDDSYVLIGFPEKKSVPYLRNKIIRKGNFLITLFDLWRNQRSEA